MENSECVPCKKPKLDLQDGTTGEDIPIQTEHYHPTVNGDSNNHDRLTAGDVDTEATTTNHGEGGHFHEPPGSPTPGPSTQKEAEEDNVSVISGLSDLSGKDWKPNMKGKVGWLARAMQRGTDPRDIATNIFQSDASILNQMDDMTIWQILFKMFTEPPRREKLKHFNTIEDIVGHIKEAKNILVLTGAGVSVSCGIPDFRSKDGVYARLAVDFPDLPDPQAMFDIQYFRRDPRPFFKFAKEIYPGQFTPSPCHKFISCLEKTGKLLRNYTQNIDTLEQVAGISKIVQCHGSFASASCTVCKLKVDAEQVRSDIMEQKIPLCNKCPSPDLEGILERLKPKPCVEATDACAEDLIQTESKAELCDQSTPREGSEDTGAGNLPELQSSQSKTDQMDTSPITPEIGENASSRQPESEHEQSKPEGDNSSTKPTGPSLPCTIEPSPFTGVPIMKPDIVFFGEGLSDEFHKTITEDKDQVDLLIVIGSSLKVRPVALIPSSIPESVPQILINRERLSHLTFDVELLGDCDTIINQLCHMLEGDWSHPIHRPPLSQTLALPELNSSESKSDDALDNSKEDDDDDDEPSKTESEKAEEPSNQSNSTGGAVTDSQTKTDGTAAEQDDLEESFDLGNPTSELGPDDPSEDWRPKPVSESLPDGHFLFLPPSRYIFSGAEVFPDDLSDNDSDEDDDEDEEDEGEEEDEQEEGEGEGTAPSSDQPKEQELRPDLPEEDENENQSK